MCEEDRQGILVVDEEDKQRIGIAFFNGIGGGRNIRESREN